MNFAGPTAIFLVVLATVIGLAIAYTVIFLAVRQALRSHAVWVATGKLDAVVNGRPYTERPKG
ncbi:hypothetical protein [Microbacterium sp. ZW T5_56]|uniref:hypothetical protein n=1 Tax=Microbacterium sp. ZW T5_56 TaxID=3378081 RepID=UPI003854BE91